MADDGSASNPRDPIKSSDWNVAVQRRRQQVVMVSKKRRKSLIWAKRLRRVGTNVDDDEDARVENGEEQPILEEAQTNIAVEELKSGLHYDHLPKELDPKTIDTSKGDEIVITSSLASSSSSSSGSRRYHVFPSFSGEDVRKSFLSHFLKELDRRLIHTFIDHGIERSRPIAPELLFAIRESRIAIVVFSKKYASSTWCLNELVAIHKCYKELNQMVIPIFYNVDPSEVRKQTGEFGKVFNKTCKGKTMDQKQKWMQALGDVANMAGEDLHNWPDEAAMIEKIANDVFNKLITPSDDFGDFVGIESHLEAMKPMLCLESEEVIMVGILGTSGIGKTTIARALFSQLSSQFPHCAFLTCKRTIPDDYGMRLCWQQQFLSDILCQKNIKIEKLGVVEQMLKHKKVLIVLDDVDDLELLKTLVGQTGWFGSESRIIVITQDRRLLKAHKIDLIYQVEFPSEAIALKMFCRSAFGQNSPPGGFVKLAVEVAKLAGNLPLGLSVLGSSLKGRDEKEWMEMLPMLQNGLDGNIEKTLRVSYDRLDRKEQELFLYLACLFNHNQVSSIRYLLGDSVNIRLKMLADKSLIRITLIDTVDMHNLLQKLGREIVRAESIDNPGKRRFLVDVEDIRDVLTDKTGRETMLGIYLNRSDIKEPLFIDENSFEGLRNLQFLIVSKDWRSNSEERFYLPQGLAYFSRKLKLLEWYDYPSKCLPCSFKAEFLVELRMVDSKLEKLWEGTLPLGSLKKMDMSFSQYLKEIPDLSNAINLEELHLRSCVSLVTLPSSIQNVIKLRKLSMQSCTKLESLPTLLNLKSLESLNLEECFRLRNFPQVILYIPTPLPHGNDMEVEDFLWKKNLHGVDFIDCLKRCVPRQFRTDQHLLSLTVRNRMIEKLWEGVQSLGRLMRMDLSECENLKEFPDLSKAINLVILKLNNCKSLVTLPCTIGNLNKLRFLEMKGCTGLEVLPTDVNLSSLRTLNLSGCKRLRSFPQISWSIDDLNLNDTAIEEVPCYIENFSSLTKLSMRGCKRLKNISPNIFRLRGLVEADFSECVQVVTALSDARVVETTEDHASYRDIFSSGKCSFKFINCFNLDGDAQELILRSHIKPTFLPGGRVPKYYTHRSSIPYLTVTLTQSSLSQEFLAFKACVVLEPITNHYAPRLKVCWFFRDTESRQHIDVDLELIYNTDHLVLVPLKFPNIAPPSELDYNDVTFEFSVINYGSPFQRIKGCGIRVLDSSPSLCGESL